MRGFGTWKLPSVCVAALLTGWTGAALAANSTTPGAITSYATFECAGVEWQITGDDNNNCVVTVEYRKQGDATWNNAQPLWRVETGLWTHGEDPGNKLAGSIFFLQPATTYDVRLTLSDPDGGSAQQIVSVTTLAEPQPDPNGRVRYVVPGSGGGSGTQADPFRGFAAADAAAQPGDIFKVQPGTYNVKFVPTKDGTATSPIVYAGADPSTVILDGSGGTSGGSNCIDLSNRQYIFIEKMTLRNCLRPILAAGSKGILISACTIQPVAVIGSNGIRALLAQNLVISDNTFQMWGDWAGIGRTGTYGTGGYAVDATGNTIIMRYNHVIEAWDGLDAGDSDGTGPRTYNVDIYNNFVDRASDDACQTDAVHQNIRVFRNRFLNSGSATSCQPSFGGPCYFLFNEMYNTRMDPFKYHQETSYFGTSSPQETSGMIAFHNTNICSKSAWYESGYWHHVKDRNNLLLGARTGIYSLYIPSGQRGDLDYDGYNRQQTSFIKYNGTAYSTFAAFYAGAGQEQHGVEVSLSEFVKAVFPVHPEWEWTNGYGTAYSPSDIDLQLAPNSVAVDKGQVLANINDGYTGSAPDLGCYERGKPVPWYGPRPSVVGGGDTTPPAAVTNLATAQVDDNNIVLTWTAPGDDGQAGQAAAYDLRMSLQPISDATFGAATVIPTSQAPLVPGSSERFVVTGLTPGTTYYFALKTRDEVPNWSGLSNVPVATTLASDTVPPAQINDLTAE